MNCATTGTRAMQFPVSYVFTDEDMSYPESGGTRQQDFYFGTGLDVRLICSENEPYYLFRQINL